MRAVNMETFAIIRYRLTRYMVIYRLTDLICSLRRKHRYIHQARTVRQKQKRIDAAYNKIEAETGRLATDEEIARELEISVDELDSWQAQTKAAGLVSLDDYMEQGNEGGISSIADGAEEYHQPEKIYEKQEIRQILLDTLESLTEKEQKVILLYYCYHIPDALPVLLIKRMNP